jgi:hypothetical protein
MRRLSKRSQKSAAHAVAIGKAGLIGDHVDRMAAALHHQPRRLDSEILDRLCLRLAGFRVKDAAELPGAEVSGLRQLLDRQRAMKPLSQIAPALCLRALPNRACVDAFANAESKHKTLVGIIRNLCYKLLVAGGFQRIGSKEIITVDLW